MQPALCDPCVSHACDLHWCVTEIDIPRVVQWIQPVVSRPRLARLPLRLLCCCDHELQRWRSCGYARRCSLHLFHFPWRSRLAMRLQCRSRSHAAGMAMSLSPFAIWMLTNTRRCAASPCHTNFATGDPSNHGLHRARPAPRCSASKCQSTAAQSRKRCRWMSLR